MNSEGTELLFLISIWKLGPAKGIESSVSWGSPNCTVMKKGSDISSTILKLSWRETVLGKGSRVFNNNSCFKGDLFNIMLIQGINLPVPKLIENSLKYIEASISDINPLTAGSKVLLVALGVTHFISLLLPDISLILKGNWKVLNILCLKKWILKLYSPVTYPFFVNIFSGSIFIELVKDPSDSSKV